MKKEVKTELTREKIINAALQEFGARGYEGASVNVMCDSYQISKGLLYHNFGSKDEVYLICVRRVFDGLMSYIKSNMDGKTENPEERLKFYMAARMCFFRENPVLQKIFCEAVMFPPAHLKKNIEEIKQEFNDITAGIIKELAADLKLRPDVSEQRMIDMFCQSFDFINVVSQMETTQNKEVRTVEERENFALNVLLYGVLGR